MNRLDVSALIDDDYRRRQRAEEPRGYIGASSIGDPCDAFLEFALRAFPEGDHEPNVLRIFEMGHMLESRVLHDIWRAGLPVKSRDSNGKQFGWQELGGHVRSNADGILEGFWTGEVRALVEIKSMNDANWQKFKRYGVRTSHPEYFDQMTMLMGMSSIHHTLFIAYNKDNSRYHHEWVEFERLNADYLETRVERVLHGLAQRIASDPDDWRCKGCKYRGPCWNQVVPPKDCRRCRWALPVDDGTWHCHKHNRPALVVCGDFSQYIPQERK